jgi:acyl-CoA reductase-like NAD-dependent aldehyde dehydrogenase
VSSNLAELAGIDVPTRLLIGGEWTGGRGGVKQSGIGREGAHEGLLEFTETKYIATTW